MPDLSPWRLLSHVRQFSIQVLTPADSVLRPSRVGSGQVRVERDPNQSTVIWREQGRWTAGPFAGISFSNSSAWRELPGQQAIELSHLRRGDAVPTFLVRLKPTASGAWVSTEPHVCGADRYSATLTWDSAGLRLAWEVRSPTDPYLMLLDARVHSECAGSAR